MNSDRTGLQETYPDSWRWLRIARRIGGWLTDAEANALFELARRWAPERDAVVVELGSWQGRSSMLLGSGLAGKQNPRLFCVDPFGQDENSSYQAEFYQPEISTMHLSLEGAFNRNIRRCGLTEIVHPIKGYSFDAVRHWKDPIDILFIDASHEYESVHRDVLLWTPFVKVGGVIALHDVSPVWPGPSRVMAEDLQPPRFGDLGQTDSLLWAVKKSDDPLPDCPQALSTTIPKSDFYARQREIASLSADRQYLLKEVERHRAAIQAETQRLSEELGRTEESRSILAAELQQISVKAKALEAENKVLYTELRRGARSRSGNDQETQLIATALREALHNNSSLRASWSWRITAPLRLVVDAVLALRLGAAALIRKESRSGFAQWLFFRRSVLQSGVFDEQYYLKRYPDVSQMRITPLFHFFIFGSAEGRQPNFLFDTEYYLAQNPDVAALHLNPLVHYLKWGGREGRNPHPDFDSAFYLQQNPDVQERGLNPLAHYLGPGTAEGRAPNRWFDTSAYLDENPYVAVVGQNPLVHCLTLRRKAG
jgi:predicted O-methyltransferase YrrM